MKTVVNRQEWSSVVRKLSGFVIGSQELSVVMASHLLSKVVWYGSKLPDRGMCVLIVMIYC
jgi:hypothetical protein